VVLLPAGLQSLQVGGLPCPWPPEPPPHTLRLPSISHLAVHVPVPFNLRGELQRRQSQRRFSVVMAALLLLLIW